MSDPPTQLPQGIRNSQRNHPGVNRFRCHRIESWSLALARGTYIRHFSTALETLAQPTTSRVSVAAFGFGAITPAGRFLAVAARSPAQELGGIYRYRDRDHAATRLYD